MEKNYKQYKKYHNYYLYHYDINKMEEKQLLNLIIKKKPKIYRK